MQHDATTPDGVLRDIASRSDRGVHRPPEVRKAHREAEARRKAQRQKRKLTPLVDEPRATVGTNDAALHLGREPQTLRLWACHENGPLRPLRINGRLAWRVSDLRKLTGAE
jgi:hypothetical protein